METTVTERKKLFYTSGEVGRLLGCSTYWINILIAKGELDTHRMGDSGWHRISSKSLDAYAERHGIILDWSLVDSH